MQVWCHRNYVPFIKNCSWFNDIEIDKKDGKLLIRDKNIEPIFLSGPGNLDLKPYLKYKYETLLDIIIDRPDDEYYFEFYKEFTVELTIYYGVFYYIIICLIAYFIYKLFRYQFMIN